MVSQQALFAPVDEAALASKLEHDSLPTCLPMSLQKRLNYIITINLAKACTKSNLSNCPYPPKETPIEKHKYTIIGSGSQ